MDYQSNEYVKSPGSNVSTGRAHLMDNISENKKMKLSLKQPYSKWYVCVDSVKNFRGIFLGRRAMKEKQK